MVRSAVGVVAPFLGEPLHHPGERLTGAEDQVERLVRRRR